MIIQVEFQWKITRLEFTPNLKKRENVDKPI